MLLEKSACDVLTVSGSGKLVVTTASGDPGYIDIDSDGTGCDQTKSIVLDVDGNGKITAGAISMWALGGGDPSRAYDSTDKDLFDLDNPSISPLPTASSAPVGRSALDWRYNCSATNACPDPGGTSVGTRCAVARLSQNAMLSGSHRNRHVNAAFAMCS